MRYMWKCNCCGGTGLKRRSRHQDTRSCRQHVKNSCKDKEIDMILIRQDGKEFRYHIVDGVEVIDATTR